MAYALQLSADERARYRFMAEGARAEEHPVWEAAGVGPGTRVADIGCGPGAILRLLAEEVGRTGRADGIDADAGTVAAAEETVADLPQATVRVGDADASGLPPREYDVAMCRHVLAHNGGREAAIVAHLRELVRPGGAVYLVDVDLATMRIYWEATFTRMDTLPVRPWITIAPFVAVGRAPG